MSTGKYGSKVRAHRRKRRLTQVELARRLGISPSYLNLIEHNQRSLTAPLLVKLAEELGLDFHDFTDDTDERLVSDLIEVFADPLFDGHGLTAADMRELAASAPGVSRAVRSMYQALQDARESSESLATRIYDRQETPGDRPEMAGVTLRLPSEDVTDFIQQHGNHFAELERAAEALWQRAALTPGDLFRDLARHLQREHGIEVRTGDTTSTSVLRRYDSQRRCITISHALPVHSRTLQLAAQMGLLIEREAIDHLATSDLITTDESRSLCRVVLANYFAAAVLMPYDEFYAAARAERYDLELLGHRFGVSFEQVCHRVTTLRRPGCEGVPFHMIRVDVAGNISKRFSASGIHFARFSGACPRWNVFSAFSTPGLIRVQISRMPDGEIYFCMARTIPKGRGGYHAPHTIQAIGLGCRVEYGRELVYSDGIDLETLEGAVPVGVTCRLCERSDCEQRAFPSIRSPLRIDENVRRLSFYAPLEEQ